MTKEDFKYDFTVVGGGLTGSLISILLARSGFKCCLIEHNSYEKEKNPKNFNPLSLNYRTILILEKYGIWEPSSLTSYPIRNLTIKCFNSLNRLKFSSTDLNLQYLGFVVDKNSLHQHFIAIAQKEKRLDIIDRSLITELKKSPIQNKQHITITDTESKKLKKIESDFIILSDGHASSLRDKLKFKTVYKDYNQISFLVDCAAKFKENLAIQLFHQDGIFALIPYSLDKTSLILTLNKEKKDTYINSQNKINIEMVEKIFGNYLKDVSKEKIINSYEMKTVRAEEIIRNNVMLLGNSSQLIHPVGAQGFNLGVRNIETIIDYCGTKGTSLKEGIYNYMDTIANKIITDRKNIFQMTDMATKIFANSKITSRITTSFLIGMLKVSTRLKLSFLKRILGLNDCSYLTIKG